MPLTVGFGDGRRVLQKRQNRLNHFQSSRARESSPASLMMAATVTPPVERSRRPAVRNLPRTEFSSMPVWRMRNGRPCCCAPKPLARTVPGSRRFRCVPPIRKPLDAGRPSYPRLVSAYGAITLSSGVLGTTPAVYGKGDWAIKSETDLTRSADPSHLYEPQMPHTRAVRLKTDQH